MKVLLQIAWIDDRFFLRLCVQTRAEQDYSMWTADFMLRQNEGSAFLETYKGLRVTADMQQRIADGKGSRNRKNDLGERARKRMPKRCRVEIISTRQSFVKFVFKIEGWIA